MSMEDIAPPIWPEPAPYDGLQGQLTELVRLLFKAQPLFLRERHPYLAFRAVGPFFATTEKASSATARVKAMSSSESAALMN